MIFNMEEFIENIFSPESNEIFTIMIDIPENLEQDNQEWQERRSMAKEWLEAIKGIAKKWDMVINPLVTYKATGNHNSSLPKKCLIGNKEAETTDVIKGSTIILSMPEFSATAPLSKHSASSKKLRVGSMPGVAKFMENTGLAADYNKIAKKCDSLISFFNGAVGAEASFSTGHKCYFDLTKNEFHRDDGMLHPEAAGKEESISNLPAGEVYTVPNENSNSLTEGELPFNEGNERGVFVIKSNKIVEIQGNLNEISNLKKQMEEDPACSNIAEFAIGVNDKATVTGNILQDEKAGFHWAFGLSEHLGGTNGESNFISPENVIHRDFVYAKGNNIECSLLEIIFEDKTKRTLIKNGELLI